MLYIYSYNIFILFLYNFYIIFMLWVRIEFVFVDPIFGVYVSIYELGEKRKENSCIYIYNKSIKNGVFFEKKIT
ncbi:hypothetical protein [Plasmodium yoelii yoelii]|uniref:Uncharacterized protein n=1 Tax=Plasmodium yoelii yoelii TaxID=73239 RepID=Q7RRZ2_PLAYO|nr:hypothetical protein [Plasmodium yoelii yoelii]